MGTENFNLGSSDEHHYQLRRSGTTLLLCRESSSETEKKTLCELDRDEIRNLILWAADDGSVVSIFQGPMANEINKASKKVGISNQMIVWNAVKLFLDIGNGHQ